MSALAGVLAVTFVWIGLIVGLSFIEAPVKFQASLGRCALHVRRRDGKALALIAVLPADWQRASGTERHRGLPQMSRVLTGPLCSGISPPGLGVRLPTHKVVAGCGSAAQRTSGPGPIPFPSVRRP